MINIILAPVVHGLMLTISTLPLNVMIVQLVTSAHQDLTDHLFVQTDIIALQKQKTISIKLAHLELTNL